MKPRKRTIKWTKTLDGITHLPALVVRVTGDGRPLIGMLVDGAAMVKITQIKFDRGWLQVWYYVGLQPHFQNVTPIEPPPTVLERIRSFFGRK